MVDPVKTSTLITMSIYDLTAREDMTVNINQGQLQNFSTIQNFYKDNVYWEKWQTLETDRFVLDGTFEPMPDDMSTVDWGLWSSSYVDPVIDLELVFGSPHTTVGFTFKFDVPVGEWGYKIDMTWYDADGKVLSGKTAYPDEADYFVMNQVIGFTRVVIKITSTVPNERYIKLMNIDPGHLQKFFDGSLRTATINEDVSLDCTELTINTLDFSVYSPTYEFSFLNYEGQFVGLYSGLQIDVYEYADGPIYYIGRYYLSTWESESEARSTFHAKDIIGNLDNTTHQGGIYNNVTAQSIFDEILSDYNYTIDPEIGQQILSGWLPAQARRLNLKQVAFATGGVINTTRSAGIHIAPIRDISVTYFDETRQFLSGRTVAQESEPVTDIYVTTHAFGLGTLVETLHEQHYSSPGNYIINLDDPAHSFTVTGATVRTAHPNWLTINVPSAGDVLITGIKYVDSQTVYQKSIDDLPTHIHTNIARFEDAYLVSLDNVEDVVERLELYYSQRIIQTFRARINDEKLLDTVIADTWHSSKIRGQSYHMTINLTGGFIATIQMRGKQLPYDDNWVYRTTELQTHPELDVEAVI